MLTATSPKAGMLKSIGSLRTIIPGVMVQDGLPPKERALLEPGTIAESFPGKAMAAAPIVTGAPPKALANLTRARFPAMLVRTIIRKVRLSNTGRWGAGAGGALLLLGAAEGTDAAFCDGVAAGAALCAAGGAAVRARSCAVAQVATQ